MSALCPGVDECSLAIYLSGFQQAITGVGTVLMLPLIGSLSDVYGRKALLTLPMTISIIPLVILAYSRTRNFFYAYYVTKTLTAVISEGSVLCLSLAYVADNVSERSRASAFGLVSGAFYAGFVGGTFAARFLSTSQTFQVAAIVSMIAVIYMRIFLKDDCTIRRNTSDSLKHPILTTEEEETTSSDSELLSSSKEVEVFKKIPSPNDLVCLLKTSKTISLAAVVAFFNSLAEGGLQASALYFFKARFHFTKNQYADVMLIMGIAGTISQMIFMPLLAPVVGEEKLLSVALFGGFLCMLMNGIAWSIWVPYVVAAFGIFTSFASPCLRSIVSKQVGPNEQGIAQGCISGISSFANIISPFIFSPLTDLFLSKRAPFYFPGFSIMCSGFATMVAFIPSLFIWAVPPSSKKVSCEDCEA
ncbi:hypothetical protein RHSIM_Rhsim11G0194000 [Rhododendron simsii]|uniref:Major facilitator superfamily (MFS) profile domain-containing protein n=1 Tax=Rhododendron simsii TaxID=118357 RepID=A0A834GEA1_RHOSS|nr:hypothetical protein RHSIM_Rhsim11G0194000 [Rhododendron simsii]